MDKFDAVLLSFEKNFDRGLQKARSVESLDKLIETMKIMIEVVEGLKPDFEVPRLKEKDDILTVKQVSKEYGISTVTIYKLIKQGKITIIPFGNKKRIRRSQIEILNKTSQFDL